MRKVKFGIVGLGNMGRMHLTNLQSRVPNAEVIAVCARTESTVKKTQEEFSIPYGYNIQVGRTHTCAHISTEIVGTKGTLCVSAIPRKNYVGQYTEAGYVEQCQDSFLARWGEAFYNEIQDFTNCILENRQPETKAKDGTSSLEYCLKLHDAYLKNQKLLSMKD